MATNPIFEGPSTEAATELRFSAPRSAPHFAREAAARLQALKLANETLFSKEKTCVLEIGCGHGHLLTAYAAAHPTKVCIGIDIIFDRITRANRKKNRARLSNLHFIVASAEDFIAAIPPHLVISDIFVLFPDPWPKRRHHKNRLMQADFLSLLHRHVDASSRLYFRTDDLSYFAATELVISAHPSWSISAEAWAFEFVTVFQERASGHSSLVAKPGKS
jgi:tRNA (guanine-N7-)-methyltransferase